jgi:1-acyl-sn-glycerol-3-phosphate acyltransferase
MIILRRLLLILWRVWFYFLCSIPVIFFFPLLALVLFLPNGYKIIFWYARNIWASFILFGMGFYIRKNQIPELDKKKSYLLVANHSSYIDPFVMLRLFKTPFVFVGKKELEKIPFFGFLYKRAAILVDRGKKESRFAVYGQASDKLDNGYSVCIFPEKEYINENNILNEFKHGAFKLAIAHKLPVLPMVFYDCKRKFPWYTTHGYPGSLRVTIFDPVPTKDLKEEDYFKLMEDTRLFIKNKLINDPKKSAINSVEVWSKMSKK